MTAEGKSRREPADCVDRTPEPSPVPDLSKLRQVALRQLARREQSRRELELRLAREDAPAELVRELLDDLAARGLQSDVRFAEALLRSRVHRGQGAVRIRQELVQRGVAAEVIDAAFAEAAIDWRQRAAEICREKYGRGGAMDWAERARRARFLNYRGFDADIIRAVLAPAGAGVSPGDEGEVS